MPLKIRDKNTFTRTVTIVQASADRKDQVDKGNLSVTYRELESDDLAALAQRQKSIDEDRALDALSEGIDTVVDSIAGFEREDGSKIEGHEAIELAKKKWSIGRQIMAGYWTAVNDPRSRAGN